MIQIHGKSRARDEMKKKRRKKEKEEEMRAGSEKKRKIKEAGRRRTGRGHWHSEKITHGPIHIYTHSIESSSRDACIVTNVSTSSKNRSAGPLRVTRVQRARAD